MHSKSPDDDTPPARDSDSHLDGWTQYWRWSQTALLGDKILAERQLSQLLSSVTDRALQSRIHNDLGVLACIDGRWNEARQAFDSATNLAPDWPVPRENRSRLMESRIDTSIGSLTSEVATPLIDEEFKVMDKDLALGCVVAVRNRPEAVVERTLETYAFQDVKAADRVLLDYGSSQELSSRYIDLCGRYRWRLIRVESCGDRWSSSIAYNAAVCALSPQVNVVFKNDVDVLIGPGVLREASQLGKERLCIFSCRTTTETATYPPNFRTPEIFLDWSRSKVDIVPMDGDGVHAFPRKWFQQIGGFDLEFGSTWGYEDPDLRLRAGWSIGIELPMEPVLIHQWHPRNPFSAAIWKNRQYFDLMKTRGEVVRNGGSLLPAGLKMTEIATSNLNHA